MSRPSDASIAQAFWQISERSYAKDGVGLELFAAVERHARELDARDTSPEARAGDCDAAEVLAEWHDKQSAAARWTVPQSQDVPYTSTFHDEAAAMIRRLATRNHAHE